MTTNSAYTAASYGELLELLKDCGYKFGDYRNDFSGDERIVYLRHDIDYSPSWALSFARINARAGATGTFFFQLRSPNYNFHAYATMTAIREICALGQRVGLHYSVETDIPDSIGNLTDRIKADFRAIQTQIAGVIPVFSWHNPSVFPGLLRRVSDVEVDGLVNTFGRKFVEQVKYYSESNLRYSVEELKTIILTGEPRLQLLFHPFQWMAEGCDMQEILGNTWVQVLREKEREFLTNHVYRRTFPSGMPQQWLEQLAQRLAKHGEL